MFDERPGASEAKDSEEQWNRVVRLEIVPHPKGTCQRMLEFEFRMEDGVLICKARAALAVYLPSALERGLLA